MLCIRREGRVGGCADGHISYGQVVSAGLAQRFQCIRIFTQHERTQCGLTALGAEAAGSIGNVQARGQSYYPVSHLLQQALGW